MLSFSILFSLLRCMRLVIAVAILHSFGSLGAFNETTLNHIRNATAIDSYTRMGFIDETPADRCSLSVEFNPPLVMFDIFYHNDANHYDSVVINVPILIQPNALNLDRSTAYYVPLFAWYWSINHNEFTLCSSRGVDVGQQAAARSPVYWMAFTSFPFGFVHTIKVFDNYGCKNEGLTFFAVNLLSLKQENSVASHGDFLWLQAPPTGEIRRVCWFDSLDQHESVQINVFAAQKLNDQDSIIDVIEIAQTDSHGFCVIIEFDTIMSYSPYVFVSGEYITASITNYLNTWVEAVSEEAAMVCLVVENSENMSETLIEKFLINYFATVPSAPALNTGDTGYLKFLIHGDHGQFTIDSEDFNDKTFVNAFIDWMVELVGDRYERDAYNIAMLEMAVLSGSDRWCDFFFSITSSEYNPHDLYQQMRADIVSRLSGENLVFKEPRTKERDFILAYIETDDQNKAQIEFGSFGVKTISTNGCKSEGGATVSLCSLTGQGGMVSYLEQCSDGVTPIDDNHFSFTPSRNFANDCKTVNYPSIPCMSGACQSSQDVSLGLATNGKFYAKIDKEVQHMQLSDDLPRFGSIAIPENSDLSEGMSFLVELSVEHSIYFLKPSSSPSVINNLLRPIILISPSHRIKMDQDFSYTSALTSYYNNFTLDSFSIIVKDFAHTSEVSADVTHDTVIVDWLLLFDQDAEFFELNINEGCANSHSIASDILLLSLLHGDVAANAAAHNDAIWLHWNDTLRQIQICWHDDADAPEHSVTAGMIKFDASKVYFEVGHISFNWPENSDTDAICIGHAYTRELMITPSVFVTIEYDGPTFIVPGVAAYVEYSTFTRTLICVAKLSWSEFNVSDSGVFRIHYVIFDSSQYRDVLVRDGNANARDASVYGEIYHGIELQISNLNYSAIPSSLETGQNLSDALLAFFTSAIGVTTGDIMSSAYLDIPAATSVLFVYKELLGGTLDNWLFNGIFTISKSSPEAVALLPFIAPADELRISPLYHKKSCRSSMQEPEACRFAAPLLTGTQTIFLTFLDECESHTFEVSHCINEPDEFYDLPAEFIISSSATGPTLNKLSKSPTVNPNPSPPNPNPNPPNPNPNPPNPNPNPPNPNPNPPNPNPNPPNPNPPNPNPNPPNPNPEDISESAAGLDGGAIAGIIIAVVVGVLIIAGFIYYFARNPRKRRWNIFTTQSGRYAETIGSLRHASV